MADPNADSGPPTLSLPQENSVDTVKKPRTDLARRRTRQDARHRAAQKAYGRGRQINVGAVKDKKLRRTLKNLEHKFETAAVRARDAEILHEETPGYLEPEGELERTWRVRQDEIQADVGVATAEKRFDLKLEPQLGPYICEYTRNGRELLLAGRKGHIATMDWREGKLGCELQLGETVRDVRWLHNNQYFAVAQKKHVYIYDRDGVELHCLRQHREVSHMEFLPYHFLLATMGMSGMLKYQDVSTGQLLTEIGTKLGPPTALGQNRWNAILHAGHQNGTVTLWSPNSSTPLVKLLAHRGPVRALDIDREGRYMVATGQDQRMSVWDIRTLKEVGNYALRQPGATVAISDSGLTAVGWGTQTTVWKGLFSKAAGEQERVRAPYMGWGGEGRRMERVRWCPFEDVLGVGHDAGFASLIIPGAGEANFDALEANPFENTKQRRETEVHGLLNKLQPEMIALDPNFVGNLDLRSDAQRRAERDLDAPVPSLVEEIRSRARGRDGALKKFLRKQRKKNIIDEKRVQAEELWEEQKRKQEAGRQDAETELGPALSRFARKA